MHIRLSFLHFGSKSRADLIPSVPRPDHTRPRPPPKKSARRDPPDHQTVLSQWRRLGSLDPKSHDHDELLRTLVDAEDYRKVALKFIDNDAAIVINIIGKVSTRDTIGCACTVSYA